MHRITTFGGVQVRDDDGELESFRSRKHVALLVYLCSNPRRVHLRENVARMFWDTDSSLARHSLSQALYDIRSTLGQVVSNVPGDALRIEADRLDFDVSELEQAIKAGNLSTAVELYTAPFAPDLDRAGTEEFERWLDRERSRLSVLGQSALRQYLTYADNHGEWGEMCSAALRLIRMNPLDEEAHRALMRGLWLHGDQVSALEHFREVRERLEGELPEGLSEETVELVRRIERSRPQASRGEAVRDRAIPLVGRQKELAVLARFAEEAATAPDSLIIEGEAGIGKTRLVEELENLLTLEGHVVLTSQCYAAEAEVAYGPVLDGLREIAEQVGAYTDPSRYLELGRLFPNTGASPSPEAPTDGQSARRRLFEEIADMLRRYTSGESESVVWIVEDVHNIDGASSVLLHYLARRLAAEPFRLVLTSRPENQQNESARQLLSEEFFVENGRRCEVTPLSPQSVCKLISAVTGEAEPDPSLVEKVTTLSGGNPFYAVEVSKTVCSPRRSAEDPTDLLTGRLRSILAAKIRGLDASAIRVLETLSVAHPHCRPIAIKRILDVGFERISRAVEALEALNLVRPEEESLVFVHDIFREYVYKNIGLVNRAALHLATAEVLAGTSGVPAWTVARHFGEGGDSERAFEHSLRAAHEAERKSACEEAVTIADFAKKQAHALDDRIRILRILARSQCTCGKYRDAASSYQELIQLTEDQGRSKETIVPRLRLADVYISLAEWTRARRSLSEARDRLNSLSVGGTERLSETIELLRLQVMVAIWSKNYREAEEEMGMLEAHLSSSGTQLTDEALLQATYALAAYQTFCGSLDVALTILEEVQGKMRRCNDPEVVCRLMLLRSATEEKLGNWDAADYWLRQVLKTTRKHHDALAEAKANNNLACVALGRGDWKKARDYIDLTSSLCDTLTDSITIDVMARVNCGKLYLYEGRYRMAVSQYKELKQLLSENRSKLSYFEAEIRAGLALAALANGDAAVAAREWAKLAGFDEGDLSGIQESFMVHWLRSVMARYIGTGDAEEQLARAISATASTDRVSAMKLEWISEVVFRGESARRGEASGVLQRLNNSHLYWFARFFERWNDAASLTLKRTRPREVLV